MNVHWIVIANGFIAGVTPGVCVWACGRARWGTPLWFVPAMKDDFRAAPQAVRRAVSGWLARHVWPRMAPPGSAETWDTTGRYR